MILTPIASAIRSPIRSPLRSPLARAIGGGLPGTYYDFTGSSLPSPWDTLRRAGLGTRITAAGALGYGAHNLLFPSRPSSPSWTMEGGTTIDVAPVAGPSQLQGAEAARLRRGSPTFAFYCGSSAAPLNAPVFYSIWLRSNTGSGSLRVGLGNTGPTPPLTVTLTANWQRVGLSVVGTATHLLYVYDITGTDEIDVAGARVQNGSDSGAADDAQVLTTTAPVYLPRPTHDPSTLAALGILVEGQATNLYGMTEAFDDAYWIKSASATVTPNVQTAPSGAVTADRLVCASSTHWVRRAVSISTTVQTYTVSIYARADASPDISITEAGATASSASFNLTTGAVSVINNGGSPSGAISPPDQRGFRRISFTYTTNGSQNTLFLNISAISAFIWGAQLEAGTVATSYIPNPGTGTAVRTGDFAGGGISGAALSALLPTAPQVLGVERVTNGNFANGSTGWTLGSGWAVSGGAALHTVGTIASIDQAIAFDAGRVFEVTYTLSGYTGSGGYRFRVFGGTTVTGTTRTADGTYTEQFTALAGNVTFVIASTTTTVGGAIDNISVREVVTPAIPGPQLPFTLVFPFRKSYTLASVETLLGLCAGASAGTTNQLGIATNGTQAQIVHSGGSGALTGTLVLDGSTVNRVAVSVDPTTGRASISVNGSAVTETTGIAYTGAGTTALILGARDSSGGQPATAITSPGIRVVPGQYITGSALQALSQ